MAHTAPEGELIVKGKVPTLKILAQNTLNTFAYQNNIQKKNLCGDNFCISETGVDYYYHMYKEAIVKCTNERGNKSMDELTTTLVEDLRKHLPHWTPNTGDKIVYTTVEEAGSANINDVGNYLDTLKSDLSIGKGFPKKVLLTGDQQTYKLFKDLQNQYPVNYNWFYAMPGDWHLMKLTAELIKSIIWDGDSRKCVLSVVITKT